MHVTAQSTLREGANSRHKFSQLKKITQERDLDIPLNIKNTPREEEPQAISSEKRCQTSNAEALDSHLHMSMPLAASALAAIALAAIALAASALAQDLRF